MIFARGTPSRRTGSVFAWIFVLPVLGGAAAEDPPLTSEPVFTALKVDGGTYSGRLAAIGADRIALVSDKEERQELPLRSLVKLTRAIRPSVEGPAGSHHVFLGDGDRVMRATATSTTETALEVQAHSSLGKLRIPLESLRGMILSPPTDADALELLSDRVLTEPRAAEVVWLTNGDRMEGGFLGLDERAAKLQIEGKPVEIDRTGVVAIGFDQAVLNYPRPASDYLELGFLDGSRLGVTGAEVVKGEIKATTRFGQPIRVAVGELARIDPRTPSVVPLTERKPDGQSYVSYVGPTRPFRADATVDGHHLQLQGQSYERGLGAQSRTILAYKLNPGDLRFQALVGVDDRAGPLGSVVFRVLTDGKERFATPAMTAKDAPRPIDVDLDQAKLLILITEFGDRGDVRDVADWVEARLIR
ncbi:MAG: NPCBM/NEW2 domain-containing protein [Isosphaeraceae bacterium]